MVFQWTVKVFCMNLLVSVGDLVVTPCGLMIWNDAANQTAQQGNGKALVYSIHGYPANIQYKSYGYVARSINFMKNSNY